MNWVKLRDHAGHIAKFCFKCGVTFYFCMLLLDNSKFTLVARKKQDSRFVTQFMIHDVIQAFVSPAVSRRLSA